MLSRTLERLALTLMAAAVPVNAATQQKKPPTYAQSLVDETLSHHPELVGIELAGRRGDGCVTIAATEPGDVGDRCDGKEKNALTSGAAFVEEPTRHDPAYIVTEALHDASGTVVGLLIIDIPPRSGEQRAAVLSRARAIRAEMEARIPSENRLLTGTPARAPAAALETLHTPRFDLRAFRAGVTNPFFPLVPGMTYRFRGSGDTSSETNVVTVTRDTRDIQGIHATVVHDEVFENGELVEDTYDWYAQDTAGNVWYLGEDSKEYRSGVVVSTEGSWETGRNGAEPGIVMWADPRQHVGEAYRQEYLAGSAEDLGKVVAVQETVSVPLGQFRGCVRTEDTSPLEPGLREQKLYCVGVGLVREIESATAGSDLIATEEAR